MKELKPFVMFATLLTLLVSFPAAMTVFLHYVTMLELTARLNPEVFYPLAGILWSVSLFWIGYDNLKALPQEKRAWVLDEEFLNLYNGKVAGLGRRNLIVVVEDGNEKRNIVDSKP